MAKLWQSIVDYFKYIFAEAAPASPVAQLPAKPVIVPPPPPLVRIVAGTVRRNDNGDDVITVQRRLAELGYSIAGDTEGVFQNATETAVKKFQADHSLLSDGICGVKTLGALGILIQASPYPGDGNYSDASWKLLPEGTIPFYKAAYAALKYDPGCETAINNVAKRILANRTRYRDAMRLLGFPDVASDGTPSFIFPGLIHNLEADGNFSKNFLNGQPLNQKTTIAPKGEGPWTNWESSVVRGMELEELTPAKIPDFNFIEMLFRAERYNGTGYLKQINTSPYEWAMSNICLDKGKYTSDGHYDPNAFANSQVGFATGAHEIFKLLRLETNPVQIDQTLADKIIANNVNLDPRMVKQALKFKDDPAVKNKKYIYLINWNINEKFKRYFLIDTATGKAENYKGAHGSGSDVNKDGLPDHFGDVLGSGMSELGAAVIGMSFKSATHKFARFVYGIEEMNKNLYSRDIRWHSATYVNDIEGQMIGDTAGCFGQSEATCAAINDRIEGILIYAFAEQIAQS